MRLLIIFPNLFEFKRFTEQFDLNTEVMRRVAVIHPPRFISIPIPTPFETRYMLSYLKHEFPTIRAVSKTSAKSGFKYTTLQKGAF